MIIFKYAAVVVIGYLFGSIPFGLLIGRAFVGKDVRQVGSGKIGMTNVLRMAGKKAAALSLLLDIAKGALPVIIAKLIFSEDYQLAQVLAAVAAIGGHSWSVFLGFKGGRGVATFMGSLLAMYWPAGVAGGALVLLIGFRTRYMSMGSIIGAVSSFILVMSLSILQIDFLGPFPPLEYVIFTMVCAIFIYAMHHDNITRLFSGTERRLDEKVDANNPTPAEDKKS